MLTTALAAAAALVSLAFAFLTHERWLLKGRAHDRTWTWAMGAFCLGAGALAWGSAGGWNSANFKAFYLFGAIVNVPLLAVGQVELMTSKPWAKQLRPLVLGACCIATGILIATPLRVSVPSDRLPQGKEVFSALPRVLAAVGSAGGATVVFVGAAYGLVMLIVSRVRRRSSEATEGDAAVSGSRVAGLALITLGTIVLSASGSLNKRFGEMTAFAITLTIGVVLLFAGFVVSSLGTTNTRSNGQPTSKKNY
jgi:hypothetical protein